MTEDVQTASEEAPVSDNLISEEPQDDTWQTRYLSEDLRDNATLGKFKDVGDLGASYIKMQEMLGSRDKIPTENSTEEEVGAFYNKLGRPATPEEYSIEMPADSGYDEQLYQGFLQQAHQSGLTNKQAQDAINFYSQLNENAQINVETTMQQAKVDAETALKKEWGAKDYQRNLALSRRAFNRFADDDLKKFVQESGVSNNVSLIRFLHKIGKSFSDPDMSGAGKDAGSVDSDSAKIEINAMMKDNGHKYHTALFDPLDSKHEEALAYRDHLYDLVYREGE